MTTHRHPDADPVGHQHAGPARPASPSPTTATARPPWPARRRPAARASTSLTVTATNSTGRRSQTIALTVNSGLAITSAARHPATAGKAFNFTVTTTGTPTADPDRERDAAAGHHVHRQRQRDRDVRPARRRDGRRHVPADLHREELDGHGQPGVHPDRRPTRRPSPARRRSPRRPARRSATRSRPPATPRPTLHGRDPAGRRELLRQRQRDRVAVGHHRGRGRHLRHPGHRDQRRRHRHPDDHPDRQGGRAHETQTVPTFTSAAAATATAGSAFSFTVTTGGGHDVHHRVTHSGTLPAGVRFINNGNGTATLTGHADGGQRRHLPDHVHRDEHRAGPRPSRSS